MLTLTAFNTELSSISVYNLTLMFIVSKSYLIKIMTFIFLRLTAVKLTITSFTNHTEGLEQLKFT